jgi:hypothetical protein
MPYFLRLPVSGPSSGWLGCGLLCGQYPFALLVEWE